MVELTVLGLFTHCNHCGVFGTDAVASFGVDTRLDGQDHTRLELGCAVAQTLWTFMDVEHIRCV